MPLADIGNVRTRLKAVVFLCDLDCCLTRLKAAQAPYGGMLFMIDVFESDSPPVLEMARRIADDGPQIFLTSDDFCKKYGAQAYAMIVNGELISPLWQQGICVAPAQYAGENSDILVGVKLVRKSR